MILTTHAIVAGAIATALPNHPVLAIGLSFVSHFVADMIPHWDYDILSDAVNPHLREKVRISRKFLLDMARIGLDILSGLVLTYYLFQFAHIPVTVALCAIAAMVPDFLQFVHSKFPHEPLSSLQRFHVWIHARIRLKKRYLIGTASQLLFNIAVIWISRL